MAYENIIVGTRGRVGMITLNRPKALNALNDALMNELGEALAKFDADEGIGAIVIAGGDKAFAAGADIGAMKDRGYRDVYMGEFVTRNWERMKSVRKPVIAAVAGYALGGGCELAMMCDIVFAAEGARFGQPEIKLGIIPGAGGTQRLPRAVGKAKAMDLVLTGRMMDAAEAERAGLVSRVVPADKLIEEALAAAAQIAEFSLPSPWPSPASGRGNIQVMQPREMRREWLLLLVLSGIQFSQMVDFMVLMPLGTQLMRAFGITPTQLGFFVSIYAVAASLSGFFSALVIDRFDRRAAMLALYAFFAATMAACALAPSYATL